MLTNSTLQNYIKAEPFRPFRIHMASGKTFEVRHPEMIRLLKTYAVVFSSDDGSPEYPDRFDTISLMLADTISHLESSKV